MKYRFPAIVFLNVLLSISFLEAAEPSFSKARTQQKARVVIVHDPGATQAFLPQQEKIPFMVERGILSFTGKTNATLAWRSLLSTNDIVGLKVYSSPGSQSGTRPAVVAAVIDSLLAAGFPPQKIIIWDRNLTDLRLSGFMELARRYKVRIRSSAQAGWDEKVFYENSILGTPVWGDFDFGKKGDAVGRKSYVSRLVTKEITKIINIAPMLNHNDAAVTGNLYSLALGSVDNIIRFENSVGRLSTAVPEIYGLPELADHVVLNIVDGLICQYQGEERSLLHYSTALNQLRFSKDPVALDVLSVQELDQQRQLAKNMSHKPETELYSNASLLELGISDPGKIDVEFAK